MTAEQKRAWFVLGVFAMTCIAFTGWALTLGVASAWGATGIFGLAALAVLIRRRQEPDERDMTISRHAALAAGLASYVVFVLGNMGAWFVAFAWHGRELVSVQWFAAITVAGAIVFFLSHSLAILYFYSHHVEAGHG